MRSNSLLPVIDHRKARDKLERQQTQTSFSSSAAAAAAASTTMTSSSGRDLPPWLAKAADELAQYIVEQQYEKAVAIVLKVRSYAANLETSGSSRFQQQSYPQLRKVMDMINGRGEHLAQTIQKSLLSLPHSPVSIYYALGLLKRDVLILFYFVLGLAMGFCGTSEKIETLSFLGRAFNGC